MIFHIFKIHIKYAVYYFYILSAIMVAVPDNNYI